MFWNQSTSALNVMIEELTTFYSNLNKWMHRRRWLWQSFREIFQFSTKGGSQGEGTKAALASHLPKGSMISEIFHKRRSEIFNQRSGTDDFDSPSRASLAWKMTSTNGEGCDMLRVFAIKNCADLPSQRATFDGETICLRGAKCWGNCCHSIINQTFSEILFCMQKDHLESVERRKIETFLRHSHGM